MRKTSQSLYQSNIKQPTAISKVFDGSSLFKSSGEIPAPSSVKKIQGHDLTSSDRLMKKNFQQTVTDLKNKPNKKVLEEEYIGGLQEEIKYLEYELKLLKDKQIIEREGVNQLDNFLKDEIPINENILAMKNKYNSTKTNLQGKYKDYNKKIAEADEVLTMQKNQIQKYQKSVIAHREQTANRKAEFKQKLFELTKEISLTKDEHETIMQQNKKKQEQIKVLNEQIATIHRKNQKEKIQEVREQQEKQKGKEKFAEKFKQIKGELIQSLQKFDQLQSNGESNPLVEPLQQQNSSYRKKIMLNDKQKSTAANIISQIQLLLREQQRERQIQRVQKYKLTSQSEAYRMEIQNLQRYFENLIKQQTERHKRKWIKQMEINYTQKQENYDLLADRLRNLEQTCSELISEKKQLLDSIQTEKQIQKQCQIKIQEQENSIVQGICKSNGLVRITSETVNQINPTKGLVEKCKNRIPIVQREIQKKKVTISHLNKQLDLLKELKTIDLQQLQMISQGGTNVQNTLHSFIKNWEKIKSL